MPIPSGACHSGGKGNRTPVGRAARIQLNQMRIQLNQMGVEQCPYCESMEMELYKMDTELIKEETLRESAEKEVQKLRDEITEIKKELNNEKDSRILSETNLNELISKMPRYDEIINTARNKLEIIESEKAQSTIEELKKEVELLKKSELVLIQNNQDMEKTIHTQVTLCEGFRTWVESNKMSTALDFKEFSEEEIEKALEDKKLLGEGGYGEVYKGTLSGKFIAIKIMGEQSKQGLREFNTEVKLLKKIHHKNIIRLVGSCQSKGALVYEYLGHGSLQDRLKGEYGPLSFDNRIHIALDLCSALIFLHNVKPHPISHCDLKPDNIMFDEDDTAKIADFGISYELEVVTNTGTHHKTDGARRGTAVYRDPEFEESGKVTLSSDTHALGLILLQLVTGEGVTNLIEHVSSKLEQLQRYESKPELQKKLMRKMNLIADDLAADEWTPQAVILLLKLGLLCASPDRKKRPSLSQSVWPQLYMLQA